eukprot:scaffold56795_cov28-Tisochrysis_lutea.AAC.3
MPTPNPSPWRSRAAEDIKAYHPVNRCPPAHTVTAYAASCRYAASSRCMSRSRPRGRACRANRRSRARTRLLRLRKQRERDLHGDRGRPRRLS